MRPELRLLAVAVATTGLCACATQQPATTVAASNPSPLIATAVEMARAAESLRGRTRGEVIAARGPATIIPFDSGYEVWVYRYVEPAPRNPADKPDYAPAARQRAEGERPPSELVLLFAPSGVVAKVRVRSGST